MGTASRIVYKANKPFIHDYDASGGDVVRTSSLVKRSLVLDRVPLWPNAFESATLVKRAGHAMHDPVRRPSTYDVVIHQVVH